MNKLAIATCLFAFIALASTAPALEPCLQLLADEFVKIEVPEPVSAYVASLTSLLPVDGENEWDEAEFKKIERVVDYPWWSCYFYDKNVSTVAEEVLAQRKDCADVVKTLHEPKHDDDQEVNELRKDALAHEMLGPRMKANIACTKFQPYRDIATLPACIQKTIDRSKTFHVPEVVKQFVLDSRKMKELVDHETVQRFKSDDLVEGCTIYLDTIKDINLKINKEDCLDEFEEIMNNWNLAHAFSRVAMEDEQYELAQHARMGCAALLNL